MPTDNVRPCPHCGGTGEQRFAYWVCLKYQGDSEWLGPYDTRASADEVARRNNNPYGNPMAFVVERVTVVQR